MNASDRYKVHGAACMLDGQVLPIANLSVGGLFAVTDRPPIAGQVLSLQLALPEQMPLPIQGQVTWVNMNGSHNDAVPHGFGIKITHISFVDKLTLLGYLRQSTPTRRVRQPHL
jgi:Tfp pilus assembly protein PilZ